MSCQEVAQRTGASVTPRLFALSCPAARVKHPNMQRWMSWLCNQHDVLPGVCDLILCIQKCETM